MNPRLLMSPRYERLIDALHDSYERESLEFQLGPYIQGHRWFGGQTRALRTVRLERWVPVDFAGRSACFCVVSAVDDSGVQTDHQLVLTAGDVEDDMRLVEDAVDSSEFRAELLRMAFAGTSAEGYRATLQFEPRAAAPDRLPETSRLAGVEQSNSSVIYGSEYILKLYRRLESGGNPEVELGTYLSEVGFAAAPRVLSVGRLTSADGYSADIALLQQFVASEGDGWKRVLSAAERAVNTAASPEQLRQQLQAESETLRLAAELGRVTAEMHLALSRAELPGIAPEPAGSADVDEWVRAVRLEADELGRVLQRAGSVPGLDTFTVEQAQALDSPAIGSPGMKTRVHGDYHLGQVLRSPDGFMIVDFEGEPAKPIAERRALQSPLADVAGMTRSWSYAAHTAAGPAPERAALAAAWERAVRSTFLESYYAAAEGSRLLPGSPADRDRLLALFELRKALYEVRYELNNRPQWAVIPAGAVRTLMEDIKA